MSDIYYLDFETYSGADIKKVGAFRYASDPSTEIIIMAIARNDEEPRVWSVLNGGWNEAYDLLEDAIEYGAQIYAHNAQFEHAVCKYLLTKTFGIRPPAIQQWRCTAAMCRLAAIPSSLAGAGEFLGIDMPKDKEGKRLIQKFSVPRKPTKNDKRTRVMPEDDPEDFQKFVDYCARDVVAEQQVYQKLQGTFPLDGWALKSFQADLAMNTRGIPVNRKALLYASTLMDEFLARMVPLFRDQVAEYATTIFLPATTTRKGTKEVDISKGFNPTQREVFMQWLTLEDFTGTDLTADTVEDWLANPRDLTERGQKALHTYSLIASAAVKKVPAMLNMACADGYVRGALMVFGAERTHRWTGKGMQPQNFARPRIKFTELAYDMICQGCSLDEIEDICGNFFDVLVSVIRHFIQPHDGDCLQADYSAIEARVAPWLVGEEATLQLFRDEVPLYEIMATRIFGGDVKDITQDQRFIGKQAVLGCSYNMGAPKFRGTCEGYGFTPSPEMVEKFRSGTWHRGIRLTWEERVNATYDDLADRAVTAWREANPIIVASWRQLDDAAKGAINSPGAVYKVGKLALKFFSKMPWVGGALIIKLPSGHKLVYPKARVVPNKSRGWGTVIEFWGVIPNSGGQWGWCSTYGGKCLENCTQATAGDVMRHGMECAEGAGYQAFMLVHDEILTLMSNPQQTHEELCNLLCRLAPWMDGLPLAAEGGRLPFYKK
jgi:DNA polymerase bacteriophage-type